MDYFERVQKSIDFIEANLQEQLEIVVISSKAYFSAFHFQRLFQAITGFTVQQYIRNRRLTEAARLLRETGKNILEIAITFQYGSQEAFTRAFVNCFGVPPAKYRKEKAIINDQSKINFLDYKMKIKEDINMNRPEIVYLKKTHIIGQAYTTNLHNNQYFEEIPEFYRSFGRNECYLQIPKKITPNMSYGISTYFQENGEFSFIVGEAVAEVAIELQNGFVNFEIPQGKYAEFKVLGNTDLVQNTRRYIYGTWLPNSNYERTEGPDFEITDVLSSHFPNELNLKIYIPIME
ncbi:AraC family transcriptional regulator [Lysinibacillus fusiformis]|nr:AraC family transcriptional regulator [Lysinibacillus fusiformis]